MTTTTFPKHQHQSEYATEPRSMYCTPVRTRRTFDNRMYQKTAGAPQISRKRSDADFGVGEMAKAACNALHGEQMKTGLKTGFTSASHLHKQATSEATSEARNECVTDNTYSYGVYVVRKLSLFDRDPPFN